MSFYECMKALPEGSDSSSRLALAARHLGYQGIIICNGVPESIFRPEAAFSIRGIDVTIGAVVEASNPRALRSKAASLRSRFPFLLVRGDCEEMVRAACEDPNIDVLMQVEGARRPLGIAAARAAKQNRVAIGFDLSPLIRLRGSSRSRWLDQCRRSLELARKFDLSIMITANASSRLDLRSPRDLMALAGLIGLESQEATDAMRLPGRLADLNKRNWVGPGVEIL